LQNTQNNKPASVSSSILLDDTDANLFISLFKNRRPVSCKEPVFDMTAVKNRLSFILSSQSQSFNQRPVPVDILFLDIVQKASAPANQNQQPPS
jgi:hypothetical protein